MGTIFKRGMVAAALIAGVAAVHITSPATAGAAAVHTATGSYIPENVSAHKDGSYNASVCNSTTTPWTYSKTYSSSHAVTNAVTRDASSDWWAPYCDNVGMGVGLDDTVYAYEVKDAFGNYERRLSAYRANAEMWHEPFRAEACPSANTPEAKQGELFFPTIGFNKYVFVYAYAPAGCSSPDNRLYMLDALDGQVIDSLPLQGPSLSGSWHPKQFDHVFPGENGVAFLDGTTVRYAAFDTNNTASDITDDELVEGTGTALNLAQSSGQFILHASGNGAGYVYAILSNGTQSDANNPNATCTGSVELVRATPASGTNPGRSTVPVSTCSFVPDSVTISPDNGVIVLGAQPGTSGAYDDMLVKYSVSDTVVYNKNLNNLSNEGFATVRMTSQPAVDNNGVAILVSTADVTQYSNSDRYVVVRKVDTSGNSSIVYASSDDYTMDPNGQDKFGAGTKVDLQSGKAYFMSCKLEWYANFCGTTNNTFVTVVDLVNAIGDRYPRSEPLSSYNYSTLDIDKDGLNMGRENIQGTNDYDYDLDNDGINDYKESQWYGYLIETYCKPNPVDYEEDCAVPNPLVKDVYVQIDWVKQTNGPSTQITPNQIVPVIQAFDALGIKAHFDIGQTTGNNSLVSSGDEVGDYGGGDEISRDEEIFHFNVPSVPGKEDILYYKLGSVSKDATNTTEPSHFATLYREGVWRYMISAEKLAKSNTPSSPDYSIVHPTLRGQAWSGDDDIAIAHQSILDLVGSNSFDAAISKTILHELGHSLCLADEKQYEAQSEQCIYSGIDISEEDPFWDDEIHFGYYSIMNYTHALNNGTAAPELSFANSNEFITHNDHLAILVGMSDFANKSKRYDLTGDNVFDAYDDNLPCSITCK